MEVITVGEPKTCPSRILQSYVADISFRCLKFKGLSLKNCLFDIDIPVSLFAVVVVVLVVGVKQTQLSLGVSYYIYIFVLYLLLDKVQRRI